MARTRRAQIRMEPAEYEQLEAIARRRQVSVGELIRAAVRAQYLGSTAAREEAAEHIAAMRLPVAPWEELERDIEEAYDAGLP